MQCIYNIYLAPFRLFTCFIIGLINNGPTLQSSKQVWMQGRTTFSSRIQFQYFLFSSDYRIIFNLFCACSRSCKWFPSSMWTVVSLESFILNDANPVSVDLSWLYTVQGVGTEDRIFLVYLWIQCFSFSFFLSLILWAMYESDTAVYVEILQSFYDFRFLFLSKDTVGIIYLWKVFWSSSRI